MYRSIALWKYSEASSKGWITYSRWSLANEIPSYAIEQANQEVQQEDHHRQTKHKMHSNFHTFKFCVYLISYTRFKFFLCARAFVPLIGPKCCNYLCKWQMLMFSWQRKGNTIYRRSGNFCCNKCTVK